MSRAQRDPLPFAVAFVAHALAVDGANDVRHIATFGMGENLAKLIALREGFDVWELSITVQDEAKRIEASL